jgi:type III secretory pathway component EscV
VADARRAAADGEAAGVLRSAGDLYVALELPGSAGDAYRAAVERTASDDRPARGDLMIRQGIAAAAAGDSRAAAAALHDAFQLLRLEFGRTGAAARVVDVCDTVTPRPAALDMALRAVIADTTLSPGERRRLAAQRLRSLRAPTDALMELPPVVIKADPALLADGGGEDDLNAMLHETIPDARDRLEEITGVEIPGVLVVGDTQIGRRVFRVVLHQVPYGGGRVPAGAMLCTDASACERSGLEGVPFGNAWEGPATARWVEPEQAETLDLPVLGTHDALVWHLEGLLRLLLFRLVGMTEVDHMLESWRAGGDTAKRSTLIEATLPDTASRVCFASLVRRLVREQVPVRDLEAVLAGFGAGRDGVFDLGTTVDRVRARLLRFLPGVDGTRETLTVPPEIAGAVASAVAVEGVLDRERARTLLGAIGDALVEIPPARLAIVVEDSAHRSAVQGAAESVARSAAVLAARELLEHNRSTVEAVTA